MTTHEQNKKAIQEGQKGGPAQKNQNTQLGLSGERDVKSGLKEDSQNPGETDNSGGQGKQDAPQNQKR